ncbi:MAG: phage major tail tube protein [Alsobacter sp.]
MSTLYIMEAANLFCGDHDPTKSKHLSLSELKLPALQAMYQEHHAGGALMQIELEMGIQKLEPTFKLVGFDPDVLVQFGLGSRIKHVYTAYGVIVDRRTGRKIEAKTIMEGRLGKMEADAFSRGNLLATDYAINEVTHYELWFDGHEKFYWDFFTNAWRVDGASEVSDTNRILRIAGA